MLGPHFPSIPCRRGSLRQLGAGVTTPNMQNGNKLLESTEQKGWSALLSFLDEAAPQDWDLYPRTLFDCLTGSTQQTRNLQGSAHLL